MAAYGALVSLTHIIEQIEHHPRPPISLDKTQVESLTENITHLQKFLEVYNSQFGYSNEADELEMRIADAAYAAEDAIESHIVDQIHVGSTIHGEETRCFNCFRGPPRVEIPDKNFSSDEMYRGLEKAIQAMDLITRAATEKTGLQMHRKATPASSVRSSSTRQNITVGLDDVAIEIMDKLTDGQSGRPVIPIVGMGGSGKTTLAQKVYRSKYAVQHFDVLVWVTISQEYRVTDLLLELLPEKGRESMIEKSDCELGESVHKMLSGRRYLIVLDDIWDIRVWDELCLYFPNNNNGSRIMLTTRLSNLAASVVADSKAINMCFLDEDNSWDLFCKIVFGEEGIPCELEKTGKKIVQNCRGLPLAIVVVGGLVAKIEHKLEYWEGLERNLSSEVNSEDDGNCLKILHMSYMQLPIYLKPCFLYMGVFREDSRIHVSSLIKLWVAEGFVKPIRGKSLEIVAREYLHELIDRNLIHIDKVGTTDNIRFCKMHDLLRDLCVREARKERFYSVVTRQHNLAQCINNRRRIVVFDSISKETAVALNAGSLVRSLLCDIYKEVPSLDFRLLRILKGSVCTPEHCKSLQGNMVKFVNSRYIAITVPSNFKFASSIHLLWNLQTLIISSTSTFTAPSEIWKMPQLKHVESRNGLILPDPPSSSNGADVLVNLRKLMTVTNFKCREETIKGITNIEKLRLRYPFFEHDLFDCCLKNLERLHKLEYLYCAFSYDRPMDYTPELSFPLYLKKLTLILPYFRYVDKIMENIGSLPLLEKLRLRGGIFRGQKWETVEGQFRSLKFLEVSYCRKLEYWTAECTHFPCLQHLVLGEFWYLKEIPPDIGEIPTLQLIEVVDCNDGVVVSAREILTEQLELGNDGLQVKVRLCERNKALMNLETSTNFQVQTPPEIP